MFKKNILMTTICCLMAAVSFAQDAKATLDAFVKKMYAYPAVELNFKGTFQDLKNNDSEEYIGTAVCSGDKFRLMLGDMEVYCDGKSKWLYTKSTDEVMIFPVGDATDITDNPLQFITANYKNGFKYKKNPSRTENGKQLDEIEMYPSDKKSNYISIVLTFESKSLQPSMVKYNTKDGQRYTVKITRFDTNVTADTGSFTFPTSRYPNAEVVDLR